MKTQFEFIKEIVALKEAHPYMKIHFFVANDLAEDYQYTAHHISRVDVRPWFVSDSGAMLDEQGYIEEYLEDRICNEYPYNEFDGEDGSDRLDVLVGKAYQDEVDEVILVYTEAGESVNQAYGDK